MSLLSDTEPYCVNNHDDNRLRSEKINEESKEDDDLSEWQEFISGTDVIPTNVDPSVELETILIEYLHQENYSDKASELVHKISELHQACINKLRKRIQEQADEFTMIRLKLEQAQLLLASRQEEELNQIKVEEMIKREDVVEETRHLFQDELERERKALQDRLEHQVVVGEADALLGDKLVLFTFLPTRLHAHSAESIHFRLAESQFYRVMQTNNNTYKVSQVDYIVNPRLIKQFNEQRNDTSLTPPILLFHGTAAKNIPLICENGFYDSTHPHFRVANWQLLGPGIYFAEHTNTSLQYASSSMQLLLCHVLPKTKERRPNGVWVITESKRTLPTYIVHYTTNKIVLHQDELLTTW